MKFKYLLYSLAAASVVSCGGQKPSDGEHVLHILTTNDVHGAWFDSTYVGGGVKNSLYAVKHYVDSVRNSVGAENVLLIDAGDCLQGDNGAYYFNYVDTETPHLFPRLVSYIGYDAVVVGNHDIETGHDVYDRITKELAECDIPFLAGNAIRNDNGKKYFEYYKVFDRAGLKVLVLGYTNANMSAWLTESLWSGMTFKSLLPLVQEDVDAVKAKVKPDVVIVAVHSGTGEGDGTMLESQGLDLYNSLTGVDAVITSHDHSARTMVNDHTMLINSGSHSRNLGHGVITAKVEGGKVVSIDRKSETIPVNAAMVDTRMRDTFHKDFEAVKAFTVRKVGELTEDLKTRDAYAGMCGYVNLVHAIGLQFAELSLAAPLTFNGTVTKGDLIYNDLFTIYPFENQLFVMEISGSELKNYLELSYDRWINTVSDLKAVAAGRSDEHVLKIRAGLDQRTGQKNWSFINRSYNFDSAAGIVYTVDLTKPYGSRIAIASMADGSAFELEKMYKVAVTSYRSGGEQMKEGTGIEDTESRIVERYPEYREMIYQYLEKNGKIDPDAIAAQPNLGHWEFIPAEDAAAAIARDMKLLFE